MRSSTRATARCTPARTAGCTAAPSSARPTWARPGRAPRASACRRRAGSSSRPRGISNRATPSEPSTLWLGGEPGVLFRSDDSGASWQVNEGVLGHETRDKWTPGAGGLITHSITLDPDDAQRLWIGISAAGVFRTEDGGDLLDAREQRHGGLLLPRRQVPRGRPVRAQGARSSRSAGPPLAAEPLRCLPLRRRRRQLGAPRRQRASVGVRLRDRARPGRPGHARS